MAPVTAAILSLYSIAPQVAPTLSFPAFTMVKFDPAVVSAATIGNKRYESITLGSGSSAPTISFPLLPPASADILLKKVALRSAFAAIRPHVETVPSRAIFDAFASRISLDIQAIDAECHQVCDTIRQAFLQPGHPAITVSWTLKSRSYSCRSAHSAPESGTWVSVRMMPL